MEILTSFMEWSKKISKDNFSMSIMQSDQQILSCPKFFFFLNYIDKKKPTTVQFHNNNPLCEGTPKRQFSMSRFN